MATLLEMLDDLRDRLTDPGDTKYSLVRKKAWINAGQSSMFPHIYRIVRDSSIVLVSNDFEYNIPAAVATDARILGVEVEDSDLDGHFHKLGGESYDILPGVTDSILSLKGVYLPSAVGANIRITSAMPLTTLVNTGDTYTGPAITAELPVLYAMGTAMSRDVEQRLQWSRFSATQGLNGIGMDDFVTSSQYWMQRFDMLLERFAMPAPGL